MMLRTAVTAGCFLGPRPSGRTRGPTYTTANRNGSCDRRAPIVGVQMSLPEPGRGVSSGAAGTL